MSRGFSDCCHYDEGYEDGLAEAGAEGSGLADTLRLFARDRLLAGEVAEAELLERVADEIEREGYLEARLAQEKERRERIVTLYAESRRAAA